MEITIKIDLDLTVLVKLKVINVLDLFIKHVFEHD